MTQPHLCEADVAEGLEEIAQNEIQRRFGQRVTLLRQPARSSGSPSQDESFHGIIRFLYTGDVRALLTLRTVQAVYLLRHFAVPRPKALLGDEHFRALLALIETTRGLSPPNQYKTLYLGAAGSDSAVMTRLKNELAQRIGLVVSPDEGDLLIRMRPSTPLPHVGKGRKSEGWDILVRLSPRPLASRSWRVCNFEGALNAPVAHAMALLTRPNRRDHFLNIACGSGTLLIERLACAPAARAIGCDVDPRALQCARTNIRASGHQDDTELCLADGRALPLADCSVDTLCADLPFGHLVGSHAANVESYPGILADAARVARPGARFTLITHEVRLTEALLGIDERGVGSKNSNWICKQILRVELGGLRPRIFVLQRA